MNPASQDFFQQFQTWINTTPELLAVALVGSYARNAAQADSDIDVVILARAPQFYIANVDWMHQFGTVNRHRIEDWGLVTSVRVFYTSGLEVEFGFTSLDWATLPLDEGTKGVIAAGMQVLLDCNGLLANAKLAANTESLR